MTRLELMFFVFIIKGEKWLCSLRPPTRCLNRCFDHLNKRAFPIKLNLLLIEVYSCAKTEVMTLFV